MRPAVRLALVLSAALSGCAAPAAEQGDETDGSPPPDDARAPPDPPPAPPRASNATPPPSSAWPDLDDARIRPGAQITYWGPPDLPARPLSGCTSNFLFRSPDNASLYLGTAAHCVDGLSVGDRVAVEKGLANGTLAYSSWITFDAMGGAPGVSREENDFALVRIDDAHRPLVHPAVRHYGGPIGLANATDAAPGDDVLAYGNSDFRQRAGPSDRHEGCVSSADAWYVRLVLGNPGVPGDSGGPVLTAEGEALAVLVHLSGASAVVGNPANTNGAVVLAAALAFANEHGGVAAELVTWPLLAGPGMPATPAC